MTPKPEPTNHCALCTKPNCPKCVTDMLGGRGLTQYKPR